MSEQLDQLRARREEFGQEIGGVVRRGMNLFLVSWDAAFKYSSGRARAWNYADDDLVQARGVAVELAFIAKFHLPMEPAVLPVGVTDGGTDFVFDVGRRALRVDVKGALIPRYLLLKIERASYAADLLVLARIADPESRPGYFVVTFLGWEHKSLMLLMPTRDFGAGPSHYREACELRPMSQLVKLVAP